MDIFEKRNVKPMLIGRAEEIFDNDQYIYELKFDGERLIAYLDPAGLTELRNKRQNLLLHRFPELSGIHKFVNQRCILDGELVLFVDGKPNFSAVQRRSLLSNRVKIEHESKFHPVTFVPFDILYIGNEMITGRPLEDRKNELLSVVKRETDHLRISKWISKQGSKLYDFAEEQKLEGIVAKRLGSPYIQGKKSMDWIKIKRYEFCECFVCAYIPETKGNTSILLGEQHSNGIRYKGTVSIGARSDAYGVLSKLPEVTQCLPGQYPGFKWVPPTPCIIKYMHETASGGLRHAVFDRLLT